MAYIGTSPSNGVRRVFDYTATAGQDTFQSTDNNGQSLVYTDSAYIDVYQNGILLLPSDYVATSGTTVVLDVAAALEDTVQIVAYDVFSVADTVSASDGGSFAGNVGVGGTLAVTGATTLTGALSAKGGAVFNEDSADVDFRVESNGNANMLFVDGGSDNVFIGTATVRNAGLLSLDFSSASDGGVGINDTNSGNGAVLIGFLTGGTFRGSITNNNNTAVAYNTTSDYRIKENVSYTFDATTELKKLKPCKFNFIGSDLTVEGFLAHEAQEVVPQAITGTKDETRTSKNVVLDKDENIIGTDKTKDDWEKGKQDGKYSSDTSWKASITQKHYQQIDQSKLVPLLVKTIQELEARITALESK